MQKWEGERESEAKKSCSKNLTTCHIKKKTTSQKMDRIWDTPSNADFNKRAGKSCPEKWTWSPDKATWGMNQNILKLNYYIYIYYRFNQLDFDANYIVTKKELIEL